MIKVIFLNPPFDSVPNLNPLASDEIVQLSTITFSHNLSKVDFKTIPSWIERRLKFLPEKKDIKDITVKDIKYLWEHHQRLK